MGALVILFSEPQFNTRLRTIAIGLRDSNTGPSDLERSHSRLGVALDIIARNPEFFDANCQINIERIGNSFSSLIVESGFNLSINQVERLNIFALRFISEYDLALNSDLPEELSHFVDGVLAEYENYNTDFKNQIDYIKYRMPIAILKRILNYGDFKNLRDVQGISQATNDNIENWKNEINLSEKRVSDLQGVLENQQMEYNFVGLSKGFSDLEVTIKEELNVLRKRLLFFGCVVLIPLMVEFASINFHWVDLANANPINLLASAAATVTATLLLLYFFRITLRSSDSCKAQLGQVRLRMTLCRFIQSYAEYSMEMKDKNLEALSKFESVIFSGIVSSDDKLPSTFDGIEQLSSLLKSMRG